MKIIKIIAMAIGVLGAIYCSVTGICPAINAIAFFPSFLIVSYEVIKGMPKA